MAIKCEFGGCKHEARWIARKLWGKGGEIRTCDEHKPGAKAKPGQRIFYDVKPVAKEGK